MSAPNLRTHVSEKFDTPASSHVINLPSTVEAGDLVVVQLTAQYSTNVLSFSEGWESKAQGSSDTQIAPYQVSFRSELIAKRVDESDAQLEIFCSVPSTLIASIAVWSNADFTQRDVYVNTGVSDRPFSVIPGNVVETPGHQMFQFSTASWSFGGRELLQYPEGFESLRSLEQLTEEPGDISQAVSARIVSEVEVANAFQLENHAAWISMAYMLKKEGAQESVGGESAASQFEVLGASTGVASTSNELGSETVPVGPTGGGTTAGVTTTPPPPPTSPQPTTTDSGTTEGTGSNTDGPTGGNTTQAATTNELTTGTGNTTEGPTGPSTSQAGTTQGNTTQGNTTQAATTNELTTNGESTSASNTDGPTGGSTTNSATTGASTTSGTTGGNTTGGDTTGGDTTNNNTTGASTTGGATTGVSTTGGNTTGASTTNTTGEETTGASTTSPSTSGPTTTSPTTSEATTTPEPTTTPAGSSRLTCLHNYTQFCGGSPGPDPWNAPWYYSTYFVDQIWPRSAWWLQSPFESPEGSGNFVFCPTSPTQDPGAKMEKDIGRYVLPADALLTGPSGTFQDYATFMSTATEMLMSQRRIIACAPGYPLRLWPLNRRYLAPTCQDWKDTTGQSGPTQRPFPNNSLEFHSSGRVFNNAVNLDCLDFESAHGRNLGNDLLKVFVCDSQDGIYTVDLPNVYDPIIDTLDSELLVARSGLRDVAYCGEYPVGNAPPSTFGGRIYYCTSTSIYRYDIGLDQETLALQLPTENPASIPVGFGPLEIFEVEAVNPTTLLLVAFGRRQTDNPELGRFYTALYDTTKNEWMAARLYKSPESNTGIGFFEHIEAGMKFWSLHTPRDYLVDKIDLYAKTAHETDLSGNDTDYHAYTTIVNINSHHISLKTRWKIFGEQGCDSLFIELERVPFFYINTPSPGGQIADYPHWPYIVENIILGDIYCEADSTLQRVRFAQTCPSVFRPKFNYLFDQHFGIPDEANIAAIGNHNGLESVSTESLPTDSFERGGTLILGRKYTAMPTTPIAGSSEEINMLEWSVMPLGFERIGQNPAINYSDIPTDVAVASDGKGFAVSYQHGEIYYVTLDDRRLSIRIEDPNTINRGDFHFRALCIPSNAVPFWDREQPGPEFDPIISGDPGSENEAAPCNNRENPPFSIGDAIDPELNYVGSQQLFVATLSPQYGRTFDQNGLNKITLDDKAFAPSGTYIMMVSTAVQLTVDNSTSPVSQLDIGHYKMRAGVTDLLDNFVGVVPHFWIDPLSRPDDDLASEPLVSYIRNQLATSQYMHEIQPPGGYSYSVEIDIDEEDVLPGIFGPTLQIAAFRTDNKTSGVDYVYDTNALFSITSTTESLAYTYANLTDSQDWLHFLQVSADMAAQPVGYDESGDNITVDFTIRVEVYDTTASQVIWNRTYREKHRDFKHAAKFSRMLTIGTEDYTANTSDGHAANYELRVYVSKGHANLSNVPIQINRLSVRPAAYDCEIYRQQAGSEYEDLAFHGPASSQTNPDSCPVLVVAGGLRSYGKSPVAADDTLSVGFVLEGSTFPLHTPADYDPSQALNQHAVPVFGITGAKSTLGFASSSVLRLGADISDEPISSRSQPFFGLLMRPDPGVSPTTTVGGSTTAGASTTAPASTTPGGPTTTPSWQHYWIYVAASDGVQGYTDKWEATFAITGGAIEVVAVDGPAIAAATKDGKIFLVQVDLSAGTEIFSDPTLEISSLAYDSSTQRLIITSRDPALQDDAKVFAINLQGQYVGTVANSMTGFRDAAYHHAVDAGTGLLYHTGRWLSGNQLHGINDGELFTHFGNVMDVRDFIDNDLAGSYYVEQRDLYINYNQSDPQNSCLAWPWAFDVAGQPELGTTTPQGQTTTGPTTTSGTGATTTGGTGASTTGGTGASTTSGTGASTTSGTGASTTGGATTTGGGGGTTTSGGGPTTTGGPVNDLYCWTISPKVFAYPSERRVRIYSDPNAIQFMQQLIDSPSSAGLDTTATVVVSVVNRPLIFTLATENGQTLVTETISQPGTYRIQTTMPSNGKMLVRLRVLTNATDDFVEITSISVKSCRTDGEGFEVQSVANAAPAKWSGYLTTGELRTGELDPGLTDCFGGEQLPQIDVEPARIFSVSGFASKGVEVWTQNRTRVQNSSECRQIPYTGSDDEYLLVGESEDKDVRISGGYQVSTRSANEGQELYIEAIVGGGDLGQPPGEILLPGETNVPPGRDFQDGGLACSSVVRTINGVGGPAVDIEAGLGVLSESHPELSRIVIHVNGEGIDVCPNFPLPQPVECVAPPNTDCGEVAGDTVNCPPGAPDLRAGYKTFLTQSFQVQSVGVVAEKPPASSLVEFDAFGDIQDRKPRRQVAKRGSSIYGSCTYRRTGSGWETIREEVRANCECMPPQYHGYNGQEIIIIATPSAADELTYVRNAFFLQEENYWSLKDAQLQIDPDSPVEGMPYVRIKPHGSIQQDLIPMPKGNWKVQTSAAGGAYRIRILNVFGDEKASVEVRPDHQTSNIYGQFSTYASESVTLVVTAETDDVRITRLAFVEM